jgi:hypothetical protein
MRDNLNIKISANPTYFPLNQGKLYYIIAQNGGAVYFAGANQVRMRLSTAPASQKVSSLPALYSLPCLRTMALPFANAWCSSSITMLLTSTINSASKIVQYRQKVRLAITAKNKALPVAGTFSVSVIDETKVPFDDDAETTILTSTLLTSDLKGYIEKPNYYFISKDANAAENLDILMLTQGYRRLSYRNVITDKVPQIPFSPSRTGWS